MSAPVTVPDRDRRPAHELPDCTCTLIEEHLAGSCWEPTAEGWAVIRELRREAGGER